jgi:glycosyltransferase involved in cell wall biosynthesis
LQLINTLDVGGAERLMSQIVPRLRERGVPTSVLLLGLHHRHFYDGLIKRGVEVHVTGCRSIYSPKHIRVIRRIVAAERIDVIHVHLFPAMWWAVIATLRLSNVRVIATEHSTWNRRRRPLFKLLDRFMYSRFDRVACVSEQTAQALRAWLPEITNRISVIENGVDSNAFGQSRVDTVFRSTRVLTIGSLRKEKAVDVLIRAVAVVPRAEAVIVGDGPLRGELEGLATDLGVRERVHFLGTRTDVASLLSTACVYVQSSVIEGFGIAVAEAMAAGMPVIVSDIPSLRDVVGDAGLRFTPGAHAELAEALNRVFSDANLQNEMGTRARAGAARFSISRAAEQYASLYEDVLATTALSNGLAKRTQATDLTVE